MAVVACGFALTGGVLRGHPVEKPAHHHLIFSEVTTTYLLVDKEDGQKIRVTWKVLPPGSEEAIVPKNSSPKNDVTNIYVVTVEGIKKTGQTYSLLTLGIQSPNFTRAVTCYYSAGGPVKFVKGTGADAEPLGATGDVEQAGKNGWVVLTNPRDIDPAKFDPKNDPNSNSIGFFVFPASAGPGAGKFEFQVVEKELMNDPNLKKRKTMWTAQRFGHDNDPPKNPPD